MSRGAGRRWRVSRWASGASLRARLPTSPSSVQFLMFPPDGVPFNRHVARTFFALSPDGSQLAFVGDEGEKLADLSTIDVGARGARPTRHRRRQLDLLVARQPIVGVPDRDDAEAHRSPRGCRGRPGRGTGRRAWCTAPGAAAARSSSGYGRGTGIYSVPAAGGSMREIMKPDRSKGEVRVHWPWFLPDGKRFLYTARLADGEGELRLGQLDGGFRAPCCARAPTPSGSIPTPSCSCGKACCSGSDSTWHRRASIGDPFSIARPVDYFNTTSRAHVQRVANRSGGVPRRR